MVKNKKSNFQLAFDNATEEERKQLQQAWGNMIEIMKPTLEEFSKAEVDADNFLRAMGDDKTLDEMTTYLELNPLSRIATAIMSANANHGSKFPPKRKKGSLSSTTKYIHKLATDYPNQTAKQLMKNADRKILGKMTYGTFSNHVSNARNPKP